MGKDERVSTRSSGDATSIKSGHGRYCHIVKRPDFDGYGFNLHSEKVKPGQYIGKVDPNSPAEAAGLREGDQIIEVNGVNIKNETHKQVVQRIKAISNEVRLLLTDVCNEDDPTNSAEKDLVSSKQIANITSNQKSTSTTLIAQESSTSLVSAAQSAQNDEPDHQEIVTTIRMSSRKSKSTNSNDPKSENVLNSTNGFHNKSNGQIAENNATPTRKSVDSVAPSVEQLSVNSFQDNDISNKIGLNLSLTAAEMRAKLQAKKKFDPKNESVDLKKKFDIIQKL